MTDFVVFLNLGILNLSYSVRQAVTQNLEGISSSAGE